MKKRIHMLLLILALVAGVGWAGSAYFSFVSRTIYDESTAHLTEIFHQANQTLYNLVSVNWDRMSMWTPYLESADSEEKIVAYVNRARNKNNFTDFYFISRDGNYISLDGQRGYLDLQERLESLILDRHPVVVNSVVPDKPEIMVFAIPAEKGSYQGVEYEAIAITFNNSDLVEALRISAFDGQASTFAALPDGRVVVDNASENIQDVRNIFALLEKSSQLEDTKIAAVQRDFRQGNSGEMVFELDGRRFYLVYEPANFQDWMVLGIVPTDVVNASMNQLQYTTMIVMVGITVVLALLILFYIVQQNRQKLKLKDNQLIARDELFSTLSINVDDVFLMVDAKELHVEYVSPNIEKLVGISQQRIQENLSVIEQLIKPEESLHILDQLSSIRPGEQREWDREYIHQKTGKKLWFRVVVFCTDIQGEKKIHYGSVRPYRG